MTPVGAGVAGVVTLHADVGTAIVVVPIGTGTHRGRSGPEPTRVAGQTLGDVGAGIATMVAGHTFLVHSIVVETNRTDAILVYTVKKSIIGAVAVTALMPYQTGTACVVAGWTGHSVVVVVVVLGTGAPAQLE